MKSKTVGGNTSVVEVLNVSPHGIWILVKDKEYFLDHDQFPWFKKASLEQIFEVKLLHGFHLYWEQLDIDLELESLERPEKFPLIAKIPN